MPGDSGHECRRGNKLTWLAALVVLLAAAACLFVSPLSGLLPNVGLPFGYYGKLNRVRARLQSLPNVEIVRIRGNYDITLEDFTFDLRIDGKHAVSLYFREAPANPTWELFDDAERLIVRRRRAGSLISWAKAHDWWEFSLGPDNDLETASGGRIRNGRDVFENLDRIMEAIRAAPPSTLGEPALGEVIYLSIPPADG